MLTDYSSLEQEINNAPEPKILNAGKEAKARIINVNTGVSEKNGCAWYMPVFDIPDDPMVIEFNDFFWELDRTKLDQKQYTRELYKFKTFVTSFGIDISRPFSLTDDLIGKEGWVIVGVKKDNEYGDKNTVKKYIASRASF